MPVNVSSCCILALLICSRYIKFPDCISNDDFAWLYYLLISIQNANLSCSPPPHTLRMPLVLFHRKSNQSPHLPSSPRSAIWLSKQVMVRVRVGRVLNSYGRGSSCGKKRESNLFNLTPMSSILLCTPSIYTGKINV